MTLKFKKPEAVIFDVDGTLFKTETLIVPVYHQTFDKLREEGLHEGPTPPESRILESLGKLLHEIWANVLPDADMKTRERADELLLQYEIEGLKKGIGELYPHAKETLMELKERGIRLFVASNGLELYVKEVLRAFDIYDWFEGVYSAGEYQTSTKAELVRLLKNHHQVNEAWMVGDRSSDVEAGKANGFDVIGCNYAQFGQAEELEGADAVIQSFPELIELLDSNS